MADNHLETAREALTRRDFDAASAHALIDIAESVRALRGPVPDPRLRSFGDKVVHIAPNTIWLEPSVNLADLPLEHVGGADDE